MSTLPPLPPVAVRIRGVEVSVRPATLGFIARAAKSSGAADSLALVAELVDFDPSELTQEEMETILRASMDAGRLTDSADFQ